MASRWHGVESCVKRTFWHRVVRERLATDDLVDTAPAIEAAFAAMIELANAKKPRPQVRVNLPVPNKDFTYYPHPAEPLQTTMETSEAECNALTAGLLETVGDLGGNDVREMLRGLGLPTRAVEHIASCRENFHPAAHSHPHGWTR